MKFAAIARHRGIWPLSWLCEAMSVTRAGFYAWLKRPESERSRVDQQLTGMIRTSFSESDATYGARRIRRDLRAWGHLCGVRRVQRLMHGAGLVARPRRRRRPTDNADHEKNTIASNLLDRQFAAPAPNCKWAADFTYLWTAEGWLFVAVVLDLYSRRVVGWSMHAQMTAQLVIDAMLMAIWRRAPKQALLHHSDRGSQYSSEDFQRLLSAHGVTCSMSRSGNCWDNSVAESFFSTMKTERTNRKSYATRDQARADVFDYIERFYNLRRRHSTLDYVSPAEFERMAGLC